MKKHGKRLVELKDKGVNLAISEEVAKGVWNDQRLTKDGVEAVVLFLKQYLEG